MADKEKVEREHKAVRVGESAVYITTTAREERMVMLQSKETKEKVRDYIFGLSDENPLQDITDRYNEKMEALR